MIKEQNMTFSKKIQARYLVTTKHTSGSYTKPMELMLTAENNIVLIPPWGNATVETLDLKTKLPKSEFEKSDEPVEFEVVIEYNYTPSRNATREDPPESSEIDVTSVYIDLGGKKYTFNDDIFDTKINGSSTMWDYLYEEIDEQEAQNDGGYDEDRDDR